MLIIPIFYDVEPSDVNDYENWCYKDFFIAHDNEREVQNWKNAFAMFKGYNKLVGHELMKETGGYEGELVKKVVKRVLSKLEIKNAILPNNLVGMGNHIRNLKGLLNSTDSNDDVQVIGILGMSGIGKTTIAKFIYNELNNLFDSRHCFLEDVAGKSQHDNGLISLQKQLVSKIRSREKPDIEDVDKGADKIKEAIGGKKVFIVLDNVDSEFQIEKLLMGGGDALKRICGRGSRFILTTTHEKILRASEVTRTYEPGLMGRSDALKLFCQHAFKKDCPPNDFDCLVEEVVSSAGGLPLVLVILGALLSVEKDKDSWVSISNKLIETPHSKVLERLRIGYDALDYSQRQIFLDIACFFVGVHKDAPVYMWEDCGFHPLEGIETLVRRSLITVGKGDNIIRMHDQLIQLGRQIVKEKAAEPYLQKVPRKRSRLWDHHEALETLTRYQGAEKVEALNLNLKEVKKGEYEQLGLVEDDNVQTEFVKEFGELEEKQIYVRPLLEKDFSHLPNLRFLQLRYVSLYGDYKHRFSNLRWLEWKCSEKCIPINFYPKNLVVLDLSKSAITGEWEKYWKSFKAAKKLKVLNLSGCESLTSAPDFITTLERLNLSHTQLEQINPWLSKLPALRALDLSFCKIKNLDCSTLTNLETLNLRGTHLEQISPWLSKLTALRALDLSFCYNIKNLDCSTLANLEILDLFCCTSLSEITGLEMSVSLTNLKTSYCDRLTTLRDLSNLKMLKELEINSCTKLIKIEGLEELESLELLNMMSCKGVKSLPDLSKLKRLKQMFLCNCEKLVAIGGLGGLVSMECLNLRNCESIVRLPVVSNTRMLRILTLCNCRKLSVIEGLGDLGSLEVLEMDGCKSISSLPDLSNARMLKELTLGSCEKLTELGDLRGLESLEHLNLASCKFIKLPKFSNPKKLKRLILNSCSMLSEIEGFSGLVSLEELHLTRCNSLKNTLDFSNLKSLKILLAKGLEHRTEIRGIEELKSLRHLDVGWCSLLEKLPDFSNFENMKELFAQGCEKLAQIQGLEDLKKRDCKISVDGRHL